MDDKQEIQGQNHFCCWTCVPSLDGKTKTGIASQGNDFPIVLIFKCGFETTKCCAVSIDCREFLQENTTESVVISSIVSCRFSLEPIHGWTISHWYPIHIPWNHFPSEGCSPCASLDHFSFSVSSSSSSPGGSRWWPGCSEESPSPWFFGHFQGLMTWMIWGFPARHGDIMEDMIMI